MLTGYPFFFPRSDHKREWAGARGGKTRLTLYQNAQICYNRRRYIMRV